jgi:DNA-binding NarL/FixJ family response regulator
MVRFYMGIRSKQKNFRMGNVGAMLRVASTAIKGRDDTIAGKRELVADLCRLLGQRVQRLTNQKTAKTRKAQAIPLAPLSPRLKQTLELLLAGEGEKQIAQRLRLSQHTVHVYVKALYRGFGVCSRGELLAKFISDSIGMLETRP